MFSMRPLASVAAALVAAAAIVVPPAAFAQHAVALTDHAPRAIAGIRFRFQADGAVRGGFGLAGNRLLFGTESGSLYAIDARDGRMLWRHSLRSPVLSTPALSGAHVYVTTWDNDLHALDTASGRELWRRDLGYSLGPNDYWEYYVSSPIVSGGRVYVGSGSGRVFAIDSVSGRTAWSTNLAARVRSTPLVLADKVIVGTMMGHVIALDRRNGRQLWSFATDGAAHDFTFKHNDTRSVVTEPIVVGDTVVAGGRDGNIYGIDLARGTRRWKETHDGGSWILGLAGDGKRFYSGSGSALIMQAADVATGKEIWRTSTPGAMFGGVAKAGSVLVNNASFGNLAGFDAASGAELWRFRLPDMTFASPLVADGVIYTGSDDGSVSAIETSSADAPKFDRYVFSFTNEPAQSTFWFKPETVAAIREAFTNFGYAPLGNADLRAALSAPRSDKGRKVIVIADQRFPEGIDGQLLRAFVDGGGILVFTAVDPLNYQFDEKGSPAKVDEEKEKAAFGIDPPNRERDNGNNVSTYSNAAKRLGLNGWFVTQQWARPGQVSTVLATDRSGMATAWIKNFANGGMLIKLPLSRFRAVALSDYVNALEVAARGR